MHGDHVRRAFIRHAHRLGTDLETQMGLQGLGEAGEIERGAAQHDVGNLAAAVL